jgi:peptidoglycan-N-acetylglucosamine deacetylase
MKNSQQKIMIVAALLLSIAISGIALAWSQPRWLWTMLSPLICPEAVFFVDTEEPLVALTIDDGPDGRPHVNTRTTAQILQVLAKYDAHATFFLIGNRINTDGVPLVAEMVRQGHEVGNHLLNDTASKGFTAARFTAELEETEKKILAAGSTLNQTFCVRWLRPGGGFATAAHTRIAQEHHYQVAIGSSWPYDTIIPSPSSAANQILNNVRPGSIIILHDRGAQEEGGEWGNRTVQTLEQILPELQRRGLKVATLSTLVPPLSSHQTNCNQ